MGNNVGCDMRHVRHLNIMGQDFCIKIASCGKMTTMSIPNIFVIFLVRSIVGNIILKSSDRTIIYNDDDQKYTPTPIPLTSPESQLSQETHITDHLTTPLTTNIRHVIINKSIIMNDSK